jgi:hypothetical protein
MLTDIQKVPTTLTECFKIFMSISCQPCFDECHEQTLHIVLGIPSHQLIDIDPSLEEGVTVCIKMKQFRMFN